MFQEFFRLIHSVKSAIFATRKARNQEHITQRHIKSGKMTKKELVKKISAATGYDQKAAMKAMNIAISEIRSCVEQGESVYLRGFGTFELKHRAAKRARDIKGRRTIVVPEHEVPTFRPCADFKEAVR